MGRTNKQNEHTEIETGNWNLHGLHDTESSKSETQKPMTFAGARVRHTHLTSDFFWRFRDSRSWCTERKAKRPKHKHYPTQRCICLSLKALLIITRTIPQKKITENTRKLSLASFPLLALPLPLTLTFLVGHVFWQKGYTCVAWVPDFTTILQNK